MSITSRTRVFALLGNPVGHSLSPQMQNAGFRAMGLDACYVAMACVAEDLGGVMRTLVETGGGGNVTVPHKEAAVALGRGDARVARVGAANVFAGDGKGVVVGNTDIDGLVAVLDGLGAPGTAWCVVGTGGSARAAVGAAAERGARIAVQSRDPGRAAEFLTWAATLGVPPADLSECAVVINATPVGLGERDPVIVTWSDVPSARVVLDLTYRHEGPTALVRSATARGLVAADGRELLVRQGALAWHYWFPGLTPPVEVMRAAMEGRVG